MRDDIENGLTRFIKNARKEALGWNYKFQDFVKDVADFAALAIRNPRLAFPIFGAITGIVASAFSPVEAMAAGANFDSMSSDRGSSNSLLIGANELAAMGLTADSGLHMEGILTPGTDGSHEKATVAGFEPADNFGLAQAIASGERVEGDQGADMAVRAVLKDLNIPLASVKAQTYRPVTYWLRGGGRMLTDSTGAFHGDDFPSHDAHFYSVQNTETGELAIVMGQDAAGRATALSDATSHLDGDLHVTWIDGVTNNPDGSVDLSANGHLLMNVAGTGERQEIALYVPWGTDDNGQPRIHTIHARVAGGVRGPIIEPTPGVPKVESAPINLVTSFEVAKANPEQLPDGSTRELRAAIASSLTAMYERGEIPPFASSVAELSHFFTSEPNHRIVVFENFYELDGTGPWGNAENRPMRGVTLVRGEGDVIYAVQMVKQAGTAVPGFIWYETTPEYLEYETDTVFNKWEDTISLPIYMKTNGCVNFFGPTCLKYLNSALIEQQKAAMKIFVETGTIPPQISNGDIVFMMNTQGIPVELIQ